MRRFSEFISEEEQVGSNNSAKISVLNTLISNFQKFANSSKEGDVAALTMLTAAVSILNIDSPQSLQAAKRLAQMAAQRAGKK